VGDLLIRALAAAAVILALAGCGGDSAGASDMATGKDMALFSVCGHPGDTGNSLGVGKYCAALSDCSGQAAGICATLGDPDAHFCTTTCTDGDATACGDGATCACEDGQCGCVPNSCV